MGSMTDDRTRADDAAYVFHSWSAQAGLNALPIVSAEGSWFTDDTGKRYLDFSSQLVNVNIGHQHPRLVAAIQEQAAKLCTIAPSFANDGLWAALHVFLLVRGFTLLSRLGQRTREAFG